MIRSFAFAFAFAGLATAAPAAPPLFNPVEFFSGKLLGEGALKVVTRPSVKLRVESQGRSDGKGGIILDQTIHEGSKPARQRRWMLRPTSPTTMTGTITDNPGVVSGRLDGKRLFLNYMMKGGLKAEQVMTIEPDGRSLTNRMTVRKFGMAVAHVDEVITKVD